MVRDYDHHDANGHYRIVERAEGSLPEEDAKRLYLDLLNLVHHHDEEIVFMPDVMAEVIIDAPGIKISIDAGISNGDVNCGSLMQNVLDKLDLK